MGYKLVVFDGDETLIDSDVLISLGERAGVEEELSTFHERTWRGEMDPMEALRELVTLLEGLPVETVTQVVQSRPISPGARSVCRRLTCETAVFTSLSRQADRLAAAIDADYAFGNRLLSEDGVLTGEIRGDIVDDGKLPTLRRLVRDIGISPDEVVVVGDGPQDVPMFEFAGFAIGVDPKPAAREAADAVVEARDFTRIEPYFRERGLVADAGD